MKVSTKPMIKLIFLMLCSIWINSVSAACRDLRDHGLTLLHDFDLKNDFSSADGGKYGSECQVPQKESYLHSNAYDAANNLVNEVVDNKTIVSLLVKYKKPEDRCVLEPPKYLGPTSRRFQTARLMSNKDINFYFPDEPTAIGYSGFIEIEAKMPSCKPGINPDACVGFWPGLWLWGWENWQVEHDILEMNHHKNDPLSYYTATVSLPLGSVRPQRGFQVSTGVNLSSGYHRFGMKWACFKNDKTKPCTIEYTFDGMVKRTVTVYVDPQCPVPKWDQWDEMYKYNLSDSGDKRYCVNNESFFNSFVPTKNNNRMHVILTLHVGNVGANPQVVSDYPFTSADYDKELGRMSIKSICLYK